MKTMTLPFTEGSNAFLTRRVDKGNQSRVDVEFGDGFQCDLVDLGWSDRQAGSLDEQLLARLPKGSSVDWEDRELFHLSFPRSSSQEPLVDVAALLNHVRDNPVHPDAVSQKLSPGTPARPEVASVAVPEDFKTRYPGASLRLDSNGSLTLSGAGRASRDEVQALFQQVGRPQIPAAPVVPDFPQDGFQFGQASAAAAASATAAAAGPLGGMVFVFTGGLEGMTRSEASKQVQALGARTASDVNRKTTHVVAGENPGDKLTRAQELGIPVLDQEQFQLLLSGK